MKTNMSSTPYREICLCLQAIKIWNVKWRILLIHHWSHSAPNENQASLSDQHDSISH